MRTLVLGWLISMVFPLCAFGADPATVEIQRLQLQRAQQQNELQLRMQQQQQSVVAPPSGVNELLRRNQLDLSQQWRQQQLHREQLQHEQALRAIPGAADPGSLHQMEIMRAEREGQAQLQQFRWEREAGSPVTPPAGSSGVR